jgi:putative endonuclease
MQERGNQTIAQQVGGYGEKMAADWLWMKGFDIKERNWRAGRNEIDLVCKQGKEWVFVEVKTRRGRAAMQPEVAVDYKKRKNLMTAANAYIQQYQCDGKFRLDIVAISVSPWGKQMMYFKGK